MQKQHNGENTSSNFVTDFNSFKHSKDVQFVKISGRGEKNEMVESWGEQRNGLDRIWRWGFNSQSFP